jgi:hypothetical protein
LPAVESRHHGDPNDLHQLALHVFHIDHLIRHECHGGDAAGARIFGFVVHGDDSALHFLAVVAQADQPLHLFRRVADEPDTDGDAAVVHRFGIHIPRRCAPKSKRCCPSSPG